MPIGIPASFASFQDASTPVPSVTIASTWSAIALRVAATALLADPPLS
jgi:hypothetical protein